MERKNLTIQDSLDLPERGALALPYPFEAKTLQPLRTSVRGTAAPCNQSEKEKKDGYTNSGSESRRRGDSAAPLYWPLYLAEKP